MRIVAISLGLWFVTGCGGVAPPVVDHAAGAARPPETSDARAAASASGAPTPAPIARNAAPPKLELRVGAPTVAAGQRVPLSITNVGGTAFRFDHPGGSNGCHAFRWAVSTTNARGEHFVDGAQAPGRLCTMAIVEPHTVVIQPGETVSIADFDTGRGFVSEADTRLSPSTNLIGPTPLPPGDYDVVVFGGDVSMTATRT